MPTRCQLLRRRRRRRPLLFPGKVGTEQEQVAIYYNTTAFTCDFRKTTIFKCEKQRKLMWKKEVAENN